MVDIIIIGGGIAGISAAAHLSSLGEVVVLESEEVIGYHATGRSAAIYVGSYGNSNIN
jgi:D-arginine dehydrogenase